MAKKTNHPTVFISYSHKDEKLLKRLLVHLKPLERERYSSLEIWDDTKIKAGALWQQEIKDVLGSAKAAILLISADFIASDYIYTNELPPLLDAAHRKGIPILQVIIGHSRFEKIESLSKFQTVNNPKRPLNRLTGAEQDEIFVKVANALEETLLLIEQPEEKTEKVNPDTHLIAPERNTNDPLSVLRRGVSEWNKWRKQHPKDFPDLTSADLSGSDLSGANLNGINLREANLSMAVLNYADLRNTNLEEAYLVEADLSKADISGANLSNSNLSDVDLSEADAIGANLKGAILRQANLREANFSQSDLTGADLQNAIVIKTIFAQAVLTGCAIHGISAWGIVGIPKEQSNMVITLADEPAITVDNLEAAQFIYLLLNNQKLRDIVSSLTLKNVLILGRFSAERKQVLQTLQEKLRAIGYIPTIFDFEAVSSRDITETLSTLAHMARFIIADITEARGLSSELLFITSSLPSVPLQLIMDSSTTPISLVTDLLKKYPWVLSPITYSNLKDFGRVMELIIDRAEGKIKEIEIRRNTVLSAKDFDDFR